MRKFAFGLLGFLLTRINGFSDPAHCSVPPPGLVLWLPFDEAAGLVTANLAAPGNPGFLANTPAAGSGYVRNALCFNGNSSQSVQVPDYPEIDLGGGDFTLDAWVSASSLGSSVGIILDHRDTVSGIGFGFSIQNSNLVLDLADATGATNYADSTVLPMDGQWHFVAVTVARAHATGGQFFVDGAATSAFDPTSHPGSLSNTDALFVAASSLGGGQNWNGCLDETEIFNRALSTNEIMAIYQAGSSGLCKPPITFSNLPSASASYSCLAGVPPPPLVTATTWCQGGTNASVSYSEVQSRPGSSCSNQITRTWSAVDICGNATNYVQTILVTNTNTSPGLPVLTCAGNKTVTCGSAWSFNSPGVGDACSGTNVALTFATQTNSLCPTVVTRTWTATDLCGNSNSCSQTVTIQVPLAYTFTTLAGQVESYGSADGMGNAAQFNQPTSLGVDAAGNIYVADTSNNTLRKVTPAGVVTTLAGMSGYGNAGSADGIGEAARFYFPYGGVVDNSGNVYVADFGNSTIRQVTPVGTNWVVMTLAGLPGNPGSNDGVGSQARFSGPAGVAVDSTGNIYVADSGNFTIRKLSLVGTNWVVTTLAGLAGSAGSSDGSNGAARFYYPSSVAVDGVGNVYVADSGNFTIRELTPLGTNWIVSTLAGLAGASGSTDGIGNVARFYYPSGVAADSAGNVYVADTVNHTIRKVGQSGETSTVGGLAGLSGTADGTGAAAGFQYPNGVAVDAAGQLYVADTSNETIRKGSPAPAPFLLTCAGDKTVGCGSVWTFDEPSALDACSGGSATVAVVGTVTNNLSCPQVFTRTWLLTDACGDTNTCHQTVTVVATNPPVLVCPSNLVVTACSSTQVFYPVMAVSPCCSNVTVTCTPPSGTLFAPATTSNVHCVATDCCSNTTVCDFTVTVQCPVCIALACAADKTVACGSAWDFDAPTNIVDYCCTNYSLSSQTLTNTGTCQSLLTRTWIISDSCGNTNSCSQSVTIVNTNAPILVGVTNLTVECGNPWNFIPPTVLDPCGNTNLVITALPPVTNGSCPQVVIETWVATNLCNGFITMLMQTVNATQAVTVATCVAPPACLVSWWPGQGNANDVQGANNGTLRGGTVYAPGEVGQAFSFNGSNSWVEVPDSPTLHVSGQLTLECWMFLNSTNGSASGRTVVWKGDSNGSDVTSPYGLNISQNNQLQGTIADGSTNNLLTGSNSLPTGTWCHIAFVADGSQLALFVNGAFDHSMPQTVIPAGSSYPFVIGGGLTNSASAFDGLIDELSFYNCALSSNQIAAIYNAGIAGKCKTMAITCATNKTVQCGDSWTFDPPLIKTCDGAITNATVLDTVTNGICPQYITRTWLSVDSCGNSNTCGQTVTVVNHAPPVIVCTTNRTILCDAAWNFDTPVALDACGSTNVSVFILSTVTNGAPCQQSITRTWLAQDACGNTNICDQTVTLFSAAPIVITACPSNIVVCTTNGCGLMPDATSLVQASDSCGTVRLAQDIVPGTVLCSNALVTFTVSDDCGNLANCSATVTVGLPSPILTGYSPQADGFHLLFATQPGFLYVVQFSNVLSPATWISLPAVTGDGMVHEVVDSLPLLDSRFYRLERQCP